MWWWWVVEPLDDRLELLSRSLLGSLNHRAETVDLRDHAGHALLHLGDGGLGGCTRSDAVSNGLVDPCRQLAKAEHELGNLLGGNMVRVGKRSSRRGLDKGLLAGVTGGLALWGWVLKGG